MPDVAVLGRRLEYRQTPPPTPDAPTIVFVHEGLGSLDGWRDFPDRLGAAAGCGLLAYSRWGHGRSERRPPPWPATFMHDEAEHALPALLETCGLGPVILYGHSDGGSIALLFAARFPSLARAVITEAAHVMVEDATTAGIVAARRQFDAGPLAARLARQHGANAATLFEAWSGAWLSPEFAAWDLRPDLSAVRCPVLAFQGLADQYGTPAQVRAIAGGVAGLVETWLIDGCGHAPHREAPDAVLDRVATFIRT